MTLPLTPWPCWLWFLLCCRHLYLIIWDQRYRCRVCLRRLRMPIETGSWSRMLQFGRPRIEYICPYGHGTLKEDELQISGLAESGVDAPFGRYLGGTLRPVKGTWRPAVNRVPRWRIAAGRRWCWPRCLVLLLAVFTPIYFPNLQASEFRGRRDTACGESGQTGRHAAQMVVDKAHELQSSGEGR